MTSGWAGRAAPQAGSGRRAAVADGDHVLLRFLDGGERTVHVQLGKRVAVGRLGSVQARELIGLPYGISVEVVGQGAATALRRYDLAAMEATTGEYTPAVANNKTLQDDNTAQALQADEIDELKRTAESGADIIQRLVDNSTSFASKTEFSQAKYLRRKQEKYLKVVTLVRPTLRTLCEHYFAKDPDTTMSMRIDSLAQMLNQANVRAGARLLVVDDCGGLVVAACLERLGGIGTLLAFQAHADASTFHMPTLLNLDADRMRPLQVLSWKRLRTNWADVQAALRAEQEAAPEVAKRKNVSHRLQKVAANIEAARLLRAGQFDALLVASRFDPTYITDLLAPLLAPSRPVVVYSPHSEPLAALWTHLRHEARAINLVLADTWTREYQVLPGRTHPLMTTSATSGYLLSGTVVDDAASARRLSRSIALIFENGPAPPASATRPAAAGGSADGSDAVEPATGLPAESSDAIASLKRTRISGPDEGDQGIAAPATS